MSVKDKLNNMSDTEKDRFLRYAARRGVTPDHDKAMRYSGNALDKDTPERGEKFKELWEEYQAELAERRANVAE